MTETQTTPMALLRERIDSGYFEREVIRGTKPDSTSALQQLPVTSGPPPNVPTGPRIERLGNQFLPACYGNGRRGENGKCAYRPHQNESVPQVVVDNIPDPPFTFGNRLGFIHGEPVQGPMTQFSHAIHLFDEDVKTQEEEKRKAIRTVGDSLRARFVTNQKFGKSAQLISLSDPTSGTVSAVEIANAQAEKIEEQEDEITALKEALDQAWDDIEILRIEVWRRTSICDICSRGRSDTGTNRSDVPSQETPCYCDDEPLLLLD